MLSHLQFGDFITIYSFFEKDDDKIEGSLSAKGFFDNKVYFQTHPPHTEKGESNTSVITNYRDFVFQVWPLLSFEASKQLTKIQSRKTQLRQQRASVKQNPEKDSKLQDLADELDADLQKCHERIKAELDYNKKNYNMNFGYDVTYGTDVLLQHVDSQMFLSSRIITSEADKSAFKFELSAELNSGMVFRFNPKFKLRQYGESIQYSDQLLIFSVKLNCYINYSRDSPIPFDKELAKAENAKPFKPYYKAIRTKRIDGFSERFEAFLSQSPDYHWQLKIHMREDRNAEMRINNEKKFIRGGELVRLRNKETSADLTATINFNLENAELYMRKHTGTHLMERDTVNSLFEIELAENEENRGNDCVFLDDKTSENPTFRLRHFMTGYLLGYQEIKEKKIPVLINNSTNEIKDKSIFQLKFIPTVSKDINVLRNYGAYHIEFQGGLFLKPDESISFYRENVIKIDENDDAFMPLTDKEMFLERTALQLEKGTSEQNAFQISKVSEQEKTLLLRLASAVPFLTYLRDIFRHQINDESFIDVCKKALKMLTSLIFFMIKTEGTDAIECEGIPIEEHQKIFKDMKLIEILVDLLYFPFRNKMYELDKLGDVPSDLIKIFGLSYRLIKFSIKEYRPNELYASQWLGLFMNQTLYGDSEVDIMAEPTLTELIDNNRMVLEKKISKENIKKFVELIKKSHLKKFVNILRAVCVCDNEPMILNQGEISKLMLEDDEIRSELVVLIRENETQGIELQISGDFIDMLNFQKHHQESHEFEYFISTIELMADLCLNKNFIAIDKLKNLYTFRLCSLIISNEKYEEKIRTAFLRLVMTLFIEAESDVLSTLSTVRTWEQISSDKPYLICIDKPIQQFDPLKEFIMKYLKKIADEEYMKGFELEKNRLTEQILELLKIMSICGFFKTVEEINGFFPSLLSILNSAHDVTNEEEDDSMRQRLEKYKKKKDRPISPKKKTNKKSKEKMRFRTRYNEDEETLIMMQCKQVICDILKVFFDLRTDLRLTHFMREFKKEFELLSKMPENPINEESHQIFSSLLNNSKHFLKKKIGIQEEELQKSHYDVFQYLNNPINWAQKITNMKSIEIVESAPVDIMALLLDLTLYDNQLLVNKAFELLYKLNSQSRSIFEAIREIQLLETPELVKAFQEIKRLKENLQNLVDNSEIWYHEKEDSKHNDYITTLNKMIALLEMKVDEAEKIITIIDEPDDEDIPASKAFLENELNLQEKHPEINETSLLLNYSVNKDRQELMRNLNVAECVINLINYDLEVMGPEEDSMKMPLIKLSYKFLAGFCHNNLKNQSNVESHFEKFLKHFKRNPKNDAHLLIIELFFNNKRLLFDAEKVDEVFDNFCYILENSDNLNLKEYIMNSLQTFLKYKDNSVKINQTKLISKMGSNNYKRILKHFGAEENLEDFIVKISKFQETIDQKLVAGTQIVLDIPAEIGYFSQQLLILSLVSEGKNYAAESRCQVFFPLNIVKKLLENSKNMWYLKKYLLFFLYNVYLETEKETNESANLMDQIIDLILQDFKFLSETIDESVKLDLRTFHGTTNLPNIKLDYLNVSILPCLNLILKYQLMSSLKTMDVYKSCLENLIVITPKIIDRPGMKANLSSFLNIIIKKKNIMKQLDYEQNYKNAISQVLIKEKKSILNFKKSITHNVIQKHNNEIEHVSKSEKFHKRIDLTIKSKKYNDMIEEEFTNLVNNIVNIEEITQKTYNNFCTIGFQELTTSLLKLLDPTELELNDELTIVGLKVFRKIIERENKEVKTIAAEWSPNDFEAFSKKIQFRQDQLCDFGLVEVIGNMIGSDEDLSRELKNEAILLGISMLVGGNVKVQDRFFKYMSDGINDPKNHFLSNLKLMIEEDFLLIRKAMYVKNRGYEDKIYEYQLEQTENLENLLTTKENIQSTKDLKPLNEEEQRLLDKDEEDKRNQILKKKVNEENEDRPENDVEEEEIKEKIKNCSRIYLLLRLFCEGHRQDMQEHLRVQYMFKRIHGKTHNFISNTSYKFGAMVKFINVHCTGLLNEIIDFLIEAIQGPCVNNQLELSKAKIVEFVKDLLSDFITKNDYYKKGFMDYDQQELIDGIVTKSSNLLIALIEGNTTDDILKDLCTRLDFRSLRQILAKEYVDFLIYKLDLVEPFPLPEKVNSLVNFEIFEGNMAQAFNLFILIQTIAKNIKNENDDDSENKNAAQYALEYDPDDKTPEVNNAIEFFNSNVVSIEILFHEKLHRIFFPIEPACRNLSKETRIILMQKVKRDSPNEKIMGLLKASSDLYDEMEYMTYLKTWNLSINAASLSSLRDISTLIALFLNILMLATFYRRIQTDPDQSDFSNVNTIITAGGIDGTYSGYVVTALLWAFGATQVATSGLMLIYWIVLYSKLVIKKKWRELVKENKQKMWNKEREDEIDEMDSFDIENIDGKLGLYILYVKGPDSKLFIKHGKVNFGSNFLKFNYYIKSLVMLMSEPGLLYSIFYIVVSLFGLLLSPLFYAYQLLDIISRFETLKNVIRSVTRNGNQLLLTLVLGLIILYMFTILMFFFLFDSYWNQNIQPNGDAGQLMCSTMFQCYLTTVDYGFRSGGGVGDQTNNELYEWGNRGRYYLSFLIKICSFSMINIIFLNIIFGIIIDTFAELRDEKNSIDTDMKNICFICGLDRYSFEKTGEGFEAHIDRDHRLWNYVYYIYFIRTKDETDYSGIESTIAACIERDDNSWFPIMKAIVLGEGEKKVMVGELINEKVGVLKNKMEEIGMIYEQKMKGLNKKK